MDPENIFHFKRIINLPSRGIGDKTIEKLLLFKNEDETLFDAISRYKEEFPSAKTEALVEFKDLIIKLQSLFEKLPLPEFYEELLNLTGYKEFLKAEDDDENNRVQNVEEFKSILIQLDRRADLEGMTNKDKLQIGFDDVILDETVGTKQDMNGVVLSTVHSIKGLEFRAVFVVALEEGIFPSLKEDSDIEEERRIAYVAFTRAKERIYITCVSRRLIYGRVVLNQKSRFITEYVASLDWKEHLDEQKEIEDITPIKVGDKVTHCNFGDGLVISESGNIIQILFDKDHSFRKILKDHPSLKKRK
jgi:DNA helicase-2/ATP-dependent DNA helicase PcrA